MAAPAHNHTNTYVEYVPGSGPAQSQQARDIQDLKRQPIVAKIEPPVVSDQYLDRSLNDRTTFLKTNGMNASQMGQRM